MKRKATPRKKKTSPNNKSIREIAKKAGVSIKQTRRILQSLEHSTYLPKKKTVTKRNPARKKWIVRGNPRTSVYGTDRNFWYWTGERFSSIRRNAKGYPNKTVAVGVAQGMKWRLPFTIGSIEVLSVGGKG